MTEKKSNVTADKKVYKKPELVKSVESGKIFNMLCLSSCGSQVSNVNSNCGH